MRSNHTPCFLSWHHHFTLTKLIPFWMLDRHQIRYHISTHFDILARLQLETIENERQAMTTKKRVVFTFDERSLESLERIKEQAKFGSLADAVRNSLQVSRALQQ